MTEDTKIDHTATLAVALYMANVLFVVFGGVFYLALWVLYVRRYKTSSPLAQSYLKQALIAASLSTAIFVVINIYIIANGGYIPLSRSAIVAIELYGLVVLPLFMATGVFALFKSIKNERFNFPLINRLL